MQVINFGIGRVLTQVVGILILLLAGSAALAKWPIGLHDQEGKPTLAPVLKRVTPAVVNVSVETTANTRQNPLYQDPFFRRFFNIPEQAPSQPRRQSVGSGVIVDAKEGYVITNHHVIAKADAVSVTLTDRREIDAEVIGSDERTDVALLKIDANELTAIEIGDSNALEVGDFVLAIGNPFAVGQTVTSGIVSALERSGLNNQNYEDFIQTDASINPGNSGGALVDLDGELIGINTAIIAPAGGNVGIGFAIPTQIVKAIMEQLIEFGEIRRGSLGVYINDLTPDLAEALDLDISNGAVVTEIVPGSAAEESGIQAGDIITAVDNEPVKGASDLRNRIGVLRAGAEVSIDFMRDGDEKNVEVNISDRPAMAMNAGTEFPRLEGAQFANIPQDHPRYGKVDGVLVTEVTQGTAAARWGLRSGDIVLAVNRIAVSNVGEFSSTLENIRGAAALLLLRGNAQVYVMIR